MRWHALVGSGVLLLYAALPVLADEPELAHAKLADAVQKLKGTVVYDIVSIDLSESQVTDGDLERLRQLRTLQTLNRMALAQFVSLES